MDGDEDFHADYDTEGIETAIRKFLGSATGAAYNTVDAWALIVRASSNDGSGDTQYGGLFTPPGQDMFANAGLKWLFDEGLRQKRS